MCCAELVKATVFKTRVTKPLARSPVCLKKRKYFIPVT